MQAENHVECATHGRTRAAYACGHTLASLRNRTPAGLVWTRDEDGQFNGWCAECDSFLNAHGGEWNDKTEKFARIGLLCEECFRRAAEINDIRDLN